MEESLSARPLSKRKRSWEDEGKRRLIRRKRSESEICDALPVKAAADSSTSPAGSIASVAQQNCVSRDALRDETEEKIYCATENQEDPQYLVQTLSEAPANQSTPVEDSPVKSVSKLETAISTTQKGNPRDRVQSVKPGEWTIEDVIHCVAMEDSALEIYADTFREHQIDGQALLLLNMHMIVKYMGINLGPALKIYNLVNRLKGRRHLLF